MLSSAWGAEILVRLMAAAVRGLFRSSWWPLVAIAGLAGLAYWQEGRYMTTDQWKSWVRTTVQRLSPLLDVYSQAANHGHRTFKLLEAANVQPVQPIPALHELARMVSTSTGALSAADLATQLQTRGIATNSDRVLRALRHHPFFVADEEHHWWLGRLRLPDTTDVFE